jgi:hypothetical protein
VQSFVSNANSHDLVRLLRDQPLFAEVTGLQLARLVGAAERVELAAGDALCAPGAAASALYVLAEGDAVLVTPAGRERAIESGHCGAEAAAGMAEYACAVTARTAVVAWRVPRAALEEVRSQCPAVSAAATISLASMLGGESIPRGAARASKPAAKPLTKLAATGWVCATVLPVAAFLAGGALGLPSQSAMFAAILTVVIVMWIFAIVDEFVPPIVAIVAVLFVGLAPASVALGGFASPDLMTMVGVFALASAMAASGLTYRVMLWVLSRLPDRPFWQQCTLLLGGMALSPVVPSGNTRFAILLPLYRDMASGLHLVPRSLAMTALAASTISGAMMFAPMMATSKASSITSLALLPAQLQSEFSGLFWLSAAAVAMAGLLAFHFGAMRVLLPAANPQPLPRERLRTQLALMGPPSFAEWMAVGAFAAFLVGTATVSVHHVRPSWIAGCVLVTLTVCGVIGKPEFRQQIDWSMIFFLLGMDGIVRVMKHLHLDDGVAQELAGRFGFVDGSVGMFVLAALVTTVAIRIALPVSAGAVVASVVLVPVAQANGINPWIAVFLAALFSDMWFFPYQSGVSMQAVASGMTAGMDGLRYVAYNLCMNAARVALAFLSIPWWKWLQIQ